MVDANSESDLDTALKTISNRQQRLICLLLRESEPRPVSDFLPRSVEVNRTTETDLYHNHLPRLAALDYIDWNRAAAEVAQGNRFGEIEPLLEILETHAEELPGTWP